MAFYLGRKAIRKVPGAVIKAAPLPEPELIEGKRVLLIDDIITTGSTLDEASRTLLASGASEVLAAALAQPAKE